MQICNKCHCETAEGVKFCPECGAEMNAAEKGTSEGLGNDQIFGILSYIGILSLISVFAGPKNDFCKFHANQGIALFAAEVICSVLNMTLGTLILTTGNLYPIYRIIGYIGWIFVVLSGIGIANVLQGKKKELPLIGRLRLLDRADR